MKDNKIIITLHLVLMLLCLYLSNNNNKLVWKKKGRPRLNR